MQQDQVINQATSESYSDSNSFKQDVDMPDEISGFWKMLRHYPSIAWNKFSEIGTQQDMSKNIRQKIVISNQLSFLMLLIIGLSSSIFATTTADFRLVLIVASITLIPIICIGLNIAGASKASRYFISVVTPLHILLVIVLLKKFGEAPQFVVSEYHFYTPRYYLMALGLLPVFLVDLKERLLFYSALITNVLCLYLFDVIHLEMGVGPEAFGFEFENYHQATIMPIVLLLFLYGSIISYQLENLKYERKIETLLDKEKMYTDRIKGEVAMAKTVIDGLIPHQLPKIKNLDIAGELQWSSEVGGDYYNVFELNEKEQLFIIADVVGKGLGASILVSTVHSNIETQIDNGFTDLQDFMERLNEVLCKITDRKKFITCWAGLYNTETNELKSINAGHIPPVVISKDKQVKSELTAGGPILGFFDKDEVQHKMESITLKNGESVLSYTDGVSEASNKDKKLYMESGRLNGVIAREWVSPRELIQNIVTDVSIYSQSDVFEDDLTCLVFRRTA